MAGLDQVEPGHDGEAIYRDYLLTIPNEAASLPPRREGGRP